MFIQNIIDFEIFLGLGSCILQRNAFKQAEIIQGYLKFVLLFELLLEN